VSRPFPQAVCCLILAAAPVGAQSPRPVLGASETKLFTFSQVFETFVRTYRAPAILELTAPVLKENEMLPEHVLALQERAEAMGDYDAWLGTFQEASQKKLQDRLQQQGVSRQRWEAARKNKYPKLPRLKLISWVARRPYVLIQYEWQAENVPAQKKVAVFRLNGAGMWKAWLDLEQDGVYRALLAGKTELIEDLPR